MVPPAATSDAPDTSGGAPGPGLPPATGSAGDTAAAEAITTMIGEEFADLALLHAQLGRDRMRSYNPDRDCCAQCHTGVNFGILGMFEDLVDYVLGRRPHLPDTLVVAARPDTSSCR